MNSINELKNFIESANPLTKWHETVFLTTIKLHKWTATQEQNCILLSDGKDTVKIKN